VFYNLCYEPWSRTCIKCLDSRATNIDFVESIKTFEHVLTCKNRPPRNRNRSPNLVNHKIAPTTHEIAPWGAISPTLKTTALAKKQPVLPNNPGASFESYSFKILQKCTLSVNVVVPKIIPNFRVRTECQ